MPKLVRTLAFVVFATVVASCDDPVPAVGVRLTDSGKLEFLYNPCHESRLVRSVELQSSGTVIWRIESEAGSSLSEFQAGLAPEGFTTTVPLKMEVVWKRLRVEVSGVGDDSFELTDLELGKVFVEREGNMSTEEFWARDTCG
ncbi:MAG: hypothetical protein IT300_15875 [Dehalococcoidia bacterium]|nr:hypothetical protein [Dehalococcoidia bacterium]